MKLTLVAAIAALAGCAGLQPSNGAPGTTPQNGKATGLTPLWVQRDAALTMRHYVQRPRHPDRGSSWMLPQKKKKGKILMYVGDWDTDDVYVYDYPSGIQVGILTGFSEPYGGCVDAKGDVYLAQFGNGEIVEFAHGGKKPINTYSPGGELIGCSVDSKGDVAATSFDPGKVTVYAKGNPEDGTTYSDSDCEYIWTMGYDDKDNLIGVGEYTSIDVCALLAGSKSETTLTESGITIDFPGGTMWDGKYIALGDQEAGGKYVTGVWEATLKGTTISAEGSEITFTDTCEGDYTDDVNPFILGKQNTPANRKEGKLMVGFNEYCQDSGSDGVDLWHYPAGGNPFKNVPLTIKEPMGVVVSIGT